MKYYSQLDDKWANWTYDGVHTYRSFGCFVSSLSMLVEKEPPVVGSILNSKGCFTNGLLNSDCAAKALGIEYNGKSSTFPEGYDYTVAETNYYKNLGVPQHFLIIDKDGKQYDPLNKDIKYPIVSYRLFKVKGETMDCEKKWSACIKARDNYYDRWKATDKELRQTKKLYKAAIKARDKYYKRWIEEKNK